MRFRLCREAEYEPIRRLWVQCFGGEEGGEIVAQAHLLPHRLMLRGSWREAAFFVGVCVDEKLRGKGIGRELMATALEELRRTDKIINILQPRWPEFYRQLGWDYCYDRQSYQLPVTVADLLLPDVSEGFVWAPDLAEIETLAALYGQFTLSRHGYAGREAQDWKILLADHRGEGGRTGVVFSRNVPCAYVLYNMTGDVLRVRELVWTHSAAVDAIWKYLIGLSGLTAVEKLEWLDSAGDPISLLASGSRSEPFLMGRMTDMPALLSELVYPSALAAKIELQISDPLVSWNNGRFLWSIKDGHAQIEPSSSTEPPTVSMEIGQLSQLLFGYCSVPQLLAKRSVSIINEADINALEQIFPICHNFISEYF